LLKFLINFRDRTSQQLTTTSNEEDSHFKLVDFMIQFLQQNLAPFENANFFKSVIPLTASSLLVKCYEVESTGANLHDNKMFEVPSNLRYHELQDHVNKKYGNLMTQLSYIDEQDEQITLDSDLVLKKAV
jgi:hypothetical protein